jgi:hypothetical protein
MLVNKCCAYTLYDNEVSAYESNDWITLCHTAWDYFLLILNILLSNVRQLFLYIQAVWLH